MFNNLELSTLDWIEGHARVKIGSKMWLVFKHYPVIKEICTHKFEASIYFSV